MAGYTDSSFRRLCRAHGADFTVSEMVSAKAIRMGDRKTPLLLAHHQKEKPFGIQLFGADPEDFAYAAPWVEERFHPDFIDINMGCPAPKITGGGAGSKLMDTPSLAADILRATVKAVSCPVTAKIRLGYHEKTATVVAPLLEEAGASALFVHGRTRDQMYHPPVDMEGIAAVRQCVALPVFANGDIQDITSYRTLQQQTGCNGVLIGRGALGFPQIFSLLHNNDEGALPLQVKLDTMLQQAQWAIEDKGEYLAIREMRKHVPYYLKGVHNGAKLRNQSVQIETMEDLKDIYTIALENGLSTNQ